MLKKLVLMTLLSSLFALSGCLPDRVYPGDALPTLSVANVSLTEGNAGTANLVFTVRLSKAATSAVTVNYATANDTALAGSDYTAKSGVLTISAGSISATVTVIVSGDVTIEADETLTITLTNPTGASIVTAIATGTIISDDFPTLSIANSSVIEGSTLGTSSLVFDLVLSASFPGIVSVDYTTTDGTALSTSDYSAIAATLNIAAGATTGAVTVLVGADATGFEASETLTLSLSNAVNAVLGTATATGTILNDDAGELNDTGIARWADAASNTRAVTQAAFPLQDADKGRDANPAKNNNADGTLGFSFTKLDAAGTPLVDQTATFAAIPWSCVLDQTTGRVWEVKSTAGGGALRDANHTYSWLNSVAAQNGGNTGLANGGVCTGANCDTESYVVAVNASALCGFSDWRLPKKESLRSMVDYSIATPGPTLDTAYFPNGISAKYWSASPNSLQTNFAWLVDFKLGSSTAVNKTTLSSVRLVRGGL